MTTQDILEAAAEKIIIDRAMGRIFGMMMRPERDGDAAEYERCRKVIFDLLDPPPFVDRSPFYGWKERLYND